MFVILVIPMACQAVTLRAPLHAESVQAETQDSCVSASDCQADCDELAAGGCLDDRDFDLTVVEAASDALHVPLPGLLAIAPMNVLNPIALAIRRDSDRRALPSLALYERTSRLRN